MFTSKEIIKIQIDKLHEYPGNPKKHSNLIEKSIKELGYISPVVINDKNQVLAGNGRLKALKKQGYKEIEVVKVEGLTEEEEKKFLLADNQSTILEGFDDDLLKAFDKDILEFAEIDLFEEKQAKEDDYTPPEEIKTDIKLGDLFEIKKDGKTLHKLLCGDATKAEDVERLMGGEKAVLAHNDPPYGMKKEKDGVKNDNLNFDDLLQFNKDWISLQFGYLKENGSWYCWGIDDPLMDIYSNIIKPYIKTQKATFRNLITWEKVYSKTGTGDAMGMGTKDFRMYPIADEKCLFVMCGVQGFNNNADNYFEGWEPVRNYLLGERKKAGWDVPTMKRIAGHSDLSGDHWTGKCQFNLPTQEVYQKFQAYCQQNNIDAFKKEYDELKKEYDELKKEYDELKKEYYSTRAYFDNTHDNQNNVWHFERCKERAGNHATPKPIELCNRVIKSSSQENDLVIDFFGGSGSTMIACHQLNRRCNMIELEPKYCQVILDRIKKLDNTLKINKL